MTQSATSGDSRSRLLALLIAVIGFGLSAYVEFGLTSAAAQDRFGWFVYEAGAWLLLLVVGPFLPVGRPVLVGALFAAAWLAGYLTYLRTQRERAHG